jgi:multidrug resistance protein
MYGAVATNTAETVKIHQTMSESQNTTRPSSPKPYSLFTTNQKALIITIVSFAATLSGFASNIYFPALPQIARDLSVSAALVNLTVTCYLIFQGLSPTVWGSISDTKGRRITYCCTLAIFLGACIGLAVTRDYAQLLVLRCVQSTGSASTIALGAGVIGDITKREDRGSYMGFFQGGLLMPVAIGPVVGGVLADKVGWRSVFWFLTIYGGVCFIVIVLILPETLRSMVGNGSKEPARYAKSLLTVGQKKSNPRRNVSLERQDDKPMRPKAVDLLGPGRILFHLKSFCAITYVAIHYTVWQMVLTALPTLVQHKYRLSEIQIGLIFLANGAGSMIGTLLTGKFLDHDYKKIMREYDGDEQRISIEKARLRTVWIWTAFECASVLVFGWTVDKGIHISLPIISFFVLGWAAVSLQSIVSTYLVDIHHDKSASAMASLNLVRCLLAAGGTAVVEPLLKSIHTGWTFTLLTGAMLLVGALVLLHLFHGHKRSRGEKEGQMTDMESQRHK